MTSLDATCWTLIEGAASGRAADRDEFARRYLPAVQAYLLARWKESPLAQERDDAVQEVFVECFRQGGALERRTGQSRPGRRISGGISTIAAVDCSEAPLQPDGGFIRSPNRTPGGLIDRDHQGGAHEVATVA